MKVESLTKSDNPNKKYKIVFSDPRKTIHFGSKGSSTYLDHKDKNKRANYISRHSANEDWTKINAGSLSRYLLWGDSTDLKSNLASYKKRFNLT